MRVVQAADRAVAIWFVDEEAPPLGRLLSLIRRALAASGRRPWRAVAAECFTAGGETLVIARPVREASPQDPDKSSPPSP